MKPEIRYLNASVTGSFHFTDSGLQFIVDSLGDQPGAVRLPSGGPQRGHGTGLDLHQDPVCSAVRGLQLLG